MDSQPTSVVALRRAVELAGSQTAFGELIGLSQQGVSKMLRECRPIAAEFVLAVEAATGVPRSELRPDIYPPEEFQSPGVRPDEAPAAGRLNTAAGADRDSLEDHRS